MKRWCYAAVAIAALTAPSRAQLKEEPGPDPRLKKILDACEIKYVVLPGGNCHVTFNLGMGRSQLVWIASKTETYRGIELRDIQSIAYKSKEPLPAELANALLRDNAQRKIGAWEVQRAKEYYHAVFRIKVDAVESDVKTMRDMLELVAFLADQMEKELTGKDEF
jgi:hypothetical protein